MAIVPDGSVGGVAVDKSFTSLNRRNAGSPAGAITPQYCGEIILDTTNHTLWKAEGLLNTDWIALTAF